ncbi:O-antigen ligase family protein [Fredinandcohnia onubensis]|uniref:O-antigen ligase family protein n=1 Tax=Fredinandcohnia onubensis TaxID=1571209 RepID=UPI000C0BDA02|nr:O-antigen ligase family protein [Fredinandcohnia onubensis]
MKSLISLIVIFSSYIFFTVSTLVGYEYVGAESSSSYIIYSMTIFILGILLFLYDSLRKKHRYKKNELLVLTIPFLMASSYLLSVLTDSIIWSGTTRFLYFILWGVPSILMGIYLSRNNRIDQIGKYIEIIMLIFSISITVSTIDSLIYGGRFSIAGGTYQAGGYISAFAFGLNLYYLLYGNNHKRFKFTTNKYYFILCLVILPVQIIGVFTSGARGAMVLVIAYLLIITSSTVKTMKLSQLIKYVVLLIGTAIVAFISLPNLLEIPTFNSSFNRVFSYISTDGIDWSGTSNRDIVYSKALDLVFESPLLGYGIFGMWKAFEAYPHNIFLEVLMQGGIVYFSIFIFIITLALKKLFYIIKINPKCRIIFILSIYPIIMLLFSGTYINNSLFWFSLSFIFSYNPPISNKRKLNIK